MTIRPAILSDIPAMQEIFAVARQFMVATGNPNQWVDGYPSDERLAYQYTKELIVRNIRNIRNLHSKNYPLKIVILQ